MRASRFSPSASGRARTRALALSATGLLMVTLGLPIRAHGTERAGAHAEAPAVTDARSQLALLDQTPLVPPPALPGPVTFAITPERRALLNTIRFAEGTWANGASIGYHILFGGTVVESLERHPNRVMRSRRYASAAAGAYQFMPFTWAMASRALGLTSFSPDHQDQAALYLIQRRGALPLADLGVLTPELTARLAPEWASLPTLAGTSFYGQPVRRFDLLRQFHEANLAALREASGRSELARLAQPCEDSDRLCRLDRLDQRP